ncbi:protein-L-isoaspartate O-methyltransferase domain-containing protein 2 [Nilaparvata lugens]|uniref:protein-L-isoaspartate O-methyltransferase domain-containing protein 2 n=1 Tax=Nilaparvata lugens TaxID=108931 RepID=UPI00193CA255|nr:protein-L-isoaspartate O-methyltransferase domain-containing protein 2 [Nilaparvata lugens]XP_039292371.1 protein-L-isoaspartate O-methyltransferase domain-containing protein 2 [Nilaparvata lugens]
MGSAVSTGLDNDDLVDNLMEGEYIKTTMVEDVFRAVDRGFYFLPDKKDSAYRDLAWKDGNIHMSSPCVYCEVMESLELKPGLSFLNVGSGTGYFNTMVGLILGPHGVNHGIEMFEDVVEYANKKLDEFKKTSSALDSFDFCEPKFVIGNGLCLPSGCRQYDRVYCGAACPEGHEPYMRQLIKIGGILVMPFNHHLLQVRRTSETQWETNIMLPVSFATLRIPTAIEARNTVTLPEVEPKSLQELCRFAIRRMLRESGELRHPELCDRNAGKIRRQQRRVPQRQRKSGRPRRSGHVRRCFDNHQMVNEDIYRGCSNSPPFACLPLQYAISRPSNAADHESEDEEGDYSSSDDDEGLAEDEDDDDDDVEEEDEEEEEEEEEGERNAKRAESTAGEASHSSIIEQRRKVAKREKFDSGVGDEMANGKGLSSEEEEEEEDHEEEVLETWCGDRVHYLDRGVKTLSNDDVTTSSGLDLDASQWATYDRVMRDGIMELPLPSRLKSYLNFNRES